MHRFLKMFVANKLLKNMSFFLLTVVDPEAGLAI